MYGAIDRPPSGRPQDDRFRRFTSFGPEDLSSSMSANQHTIEALGLIRKDGHKLKNNRHARHAGFGAVAVGAVLMLIAWYGCYPSSPSQPDGPKVIMDDMAGAKVELRNSAGFGLLVMEAIINPSQQDVITQLMAIPGGPRSPSVDSIEITFPPRITSSYSEQIHCKGAFPKAKCTPFRSDWMAGDGVGRSAEVEGRYTDNQTAKVIAQRAASDTIDMGWDTLVDTVMKGPGNAWITNWDGYPPLCYGYANVTNLTSKCAQFIPDPEFENETGILDVELIRSPFKGAPSLRNNPLITNKAFDAITFHTYTLHMDASGIALYIDAPNKGTEINTSTPVVTFNVSEFPSLARPIQTPPSNNASILMDMSRILLHMSKCEECAPNKFDVHSPASWIRSLAYYPRIEDKVMQAPVEDKPLWTWKENRDDGKTSSDNKTEVESRIAASSDPLMEFTIASTPEWQIETSQWNESNYWFAFRTNFKAHQTFDGRYSLLSIGGGKAPDGKNAMQLLVNNWETLKGRSVYKIQPMENCSIIDVKTGATWASVAMPFSEMFPYPQDTWTLDVWIVLHHQADHQANERRCGFTFAPRSWWMTAGGGDRSDGQECSFMKYYNDHTQVVELTDGSSLVTVPVGLWID